MLKKNKTIGILAAVLFAVLAYLNEYGWIPGAGTDGGISGSQAPDTDSATRAITAAYRAQRSDVQVSGSGTVKKVLRDDRHGSRHQRFLLRLSNNQTLLIAHNIDLAPRIPDLQPGDRVAFYGEYEWNNQGGVIHWTHHDPAGRHVDGWLKHEGRTYQ